MSGKAFQIKVAGHRIGILPCYPEIHSLCREYLCEEGEPEYWIQVSEQEIRKEQMQEGPVFPGGYLETLAVYRKLAAWMMDQDTILLHGSAVAAGGRAYLFTAPSGTGKSTHTRLWREYLGEEAIMINDDKPLLQIEKDRVTVFGTPWNGKHGLGNNLSAPLAGICVLRQGKENRIRRLTKPEAFPLLFNQIYRPGRKTEKIEHLLSLLDNLLAFPVWQMDCTISREAAKLAYETMKGETV